MFSEICVRSHFCTKSIVSECGVVLRCVLVYLLARLDSWPFLPGLQKEKGRGVLTFRRALFIIATGLLKVLEVGQVFCVSPPLF